MSEQTRNKGFTVSTVLLAVLILVSFLAGVGDKSKPPDKEDPEEEETIKVETPDGEVISLPVVDGGNPTNPISGTESNTDPRTPPVRGDGQRKQVVKSWGELDSVRGSDAKYMQCVETRTGADWENDIPRFVEAEQDNHGTRFILAVNTTASDEDLLAKAREDVPDLPDDAAIVRAPGIINTRGFNAGGCEPFWDARSMVRVSLGVVVFDAKGDPIGLKDDRGVFVDCHNSWQLATPVTTPPTTTTTSTTRPPTTTVPPSTTTTKPPLSRECQQNGVNCPPGVVNDVVQPPQDNDTSGVDTGPTPGAPAAPPPPAVRPPRDPDGESGDGGAPAPTGPTDDSDADEVTEAPPPGVDPCPLGPGMC